MIPNGIHTPKHTQEDLQRLLLNIVMQQGIALYIVHCNSQMQKPTEPDPDKEPKVEKFSPKQLEQKIQLTDPKNMMEEMTTAYLKKLINKIRIEAENYPEYRKNIGALLEFTHLQEISQLEKTSPAEEEEIIEAMDEEPQEEAFSVKYPSP